MSGIVLFLGRPPNLLSLQSTAAQMAQTQNNLSTGNKVNSALDNPTNFFTAQGLNNRSSDISNLLDNISNGVQVIQAAKHRPDLEPEPRQSAGESRSPTRRSRPRSATRPSRR